jgi:hypothetical protein
MSKNTGNQKGSNPNYLKNPANSADVRSSSSHQSQKVGNTPAPLTRAIVSKINGLHPERYHQIVKFAEEYSSRPENSGILKRYQQSDVEKARVEFEARLEEQTRRTQQKPPKNPNNLFGQFLRIARAQNFCSQEDRIKFAKRYTSQEHILHIAENPSWADVQEMLFFLRQEIAADYGRPELVSPDWELYYELSGSVNASIPFDAHQGAKKRISNALGGKLPSGGIHEVPNAFIFQVSERFNISRMKSFLQYSDEKLKALPSFLYDCGGKPIFDMKGIQDLPEGQIGIVFLDSIGTMRKSSSAVCYVRTGGRELHTSNNDLVEAGLAQAFSVEDDSDNVPFSKENMQNDPQLLQHPLQYWVEFMEKNGAFPLRVSFPEHFSSEQVEVEEEY